MIRVCWRPASSSVLRITPTRPSIMSDGAITSQPASAWTRACCASTASVSSLRDIAVVVDQPVLAVRGVGIERDVADHAEVRYGRLDRPHRAADQIVGIGRLGAVAGLQLGRRDREQGDRRDAERGRLLQQGQQPVDRQPLDARHRRHRLALVPAVQDEHRPDQVGGTRAGLSATRRRDQASRRLRRSRVVGKAVRRSGRIAGVAWKEHTLTSVVRAL